MRIRLTRRLQEIEGASSADEFVYDMASIMLKEEMKNSVAVSRRLPHDEHFGRPKQMLESVQFWRCHFLCVSFLA